MRPIAPTSSRAYPTATVTKSVARLTSIRKDDEPERLIVNDPVTWIFSTSSTDLHEPNDVLAAVGFCSRQVPYASQKSA
ncbi:hypothetical protein ABIB68_006618 [Bradyrhizobium sp. F1.2.2]